MAKKEKICPICNSTFETEDYRRKYCSLNCYKKAKGSKKIEKTCPICNKKFKTRHKEQVYCSYKCASSIKKIEKVELVCPICKKVFYKKQSEIRNVKGTPCCSLECSRKSRQKYQDLDISLAKDRLYHIWYGMNVRCCRETDKKYYRYGGRGITVCDEWKNDYIAFRKWALENGYSDELTIERIDVNGNYEPSNCTWITMEEQAKNKETTLRVDYNGEQIRLKEVAEKENINYKELWSAYKRNNKNLEKAIEVCNLHKNNLIASNKSGHRGVYFYKGKWVAFCKPKYIGRFNTFEEAVQARLQEEENRKKAD